MRYLYLVSCFLAILATTACLPTPCDSCCPCHTPVLPCVQPCQKVIQVIFLNLCESELHQLMQELSWSNSKDVSVAFYNFNGGPNFLGDIVTDYWDLLRRLNDHDLFFTLNSDHEVTTIVVTKLYNQHDINSIINFVRGLSNNDINAAVFHGTSPRISSTSNGGSSGCINGGRSSNFISGDRSLDHLRGSSLHPSGSTGYINRGRLSGLSETGRLDYIGSGGLNYLTGRGSTGYLSGGGSANFIKAHGPSEHIKDAGSSAFGLRGLGYIGAAELGGSSRYVSDSPTFVRDGELLDHNGGGALSGFSSLKGVGYIHGLYGYPGGLRYLSGSESSGYPILSGHSGRGPIGYIDNFGILGYNGAGRNYGNLEYPNGYNGHLTGSIDFQKQLVPSSENDQFKPSCIHCLEPIVSQTCHGIHPCPATHHWVEPQQKPVHCHCRG